MSKILDDMRKETAVMATIDAYKDMKASDATILEKIMTKFSLTEEEAKGYMLQESA